MKLCVAKNSQKKGKEQEEEQKLVADWGKQRKPIIWKAGIKYRQTTENQQKSGSWTDGDAEDIRGRRSVESGKFRQKLELGVRA